MVRVLAQMDTPDVAELLAMFLYNGSDATLAVAASWVPQLCELMLSDLPALVDPAEAVERKISGLLDVNALENVVIHMQNATWTVID